jgi:hypothetical protein
MWHAVTLQLGIAMLVDCPELLDCSVETCSMFVYTSESYSTQRNWILFLSVIPYDNTSRAANVTTVHIVSECVLSTFHILLEMMLIFCGYKSLAAKLLVGHRVSMIFIF